VSGGIVSALGPRLFVPVAGTVAVSLAVYTVSLSGFFGALKP
jgi:hypothetical protein